jgi:ribosomal protein S18 acetylase RimI-like enzyme
MILLRGATVADVPTLLPRTRALNLHEDIRLTDATLTRGLTALVSDASLGGAWLVERESVVIGYAIATYGFDLEFGGRDAVLTELWIDPEHRRGGVGAMALELLAAVLTERGIYALHLQVRPDNPAHQLYQRAGFERSPRWLMTRRLRPADS